MFGGSEACAPLATLLPGRTLTLKPASDAEKCGTPFTVAFKGSLSLTDAAGAEVASVSWDDAQQGAVLKRFPDGEYKV